MVKTETNYWHDDACAKAFWDQHKAPPYQELLADTTEWLNPEPDERWLDLGCGGGQLTAALWRQSGGQIGQIIAFDCAAVNAAAIAKLRARVRPAATEEQIKFVAGDFSTGLAQFPDGHFDGIVAGLAICYAESLDPATGCYDEAGYNRLLAELYRVLRPGGELVFSSVVPEPRFWRVIWRSMGQAFRVSKPGRVLLNLLKMQRYGRWLQREAQRGRFHFLPLSKIIARLRKYGFVEWKSRLSYAGQAYLVSVRKEAALMRICA